MIRSDEILHDGTPLRVGLAQVKPRKARVAENLASVSQWIREKGGELDLLVFPETCLSGYFLEGGVTEAARSVGQVVRALGEPPEGAPDVVLGFYERWSRRLYNSVVYLTPGEESWEPVHVHRKMFLPTYGVFDEARFVETGEELRAFDTRFGRVGMLICEEMWHSLPHTVLALGGAELLVVVSASPARDFSPGSGRPGNLDRWDVLATGAAMEHGVFVVVSQLAGSEGGKLFPGGSLAVGPGGGIVARGPLLDEALVRADLEVRDIDRARYDSPLLSDLEQMLPHLQRALERTRKGGADHEPGGVEPTSLGGRPEEEASGVGPTPEDHSVLELDLELVEASLVAFIREEVVRRRGFQKVVVGVSGGVDSSLSLMLACKALGPENVIGYRLPYATSSPQSLEHAHLMLELTGATERTVDITPAVDAYVHEHEPKISDQRRGNLAARFRALTLFDQSAKHHALPLGTGNKSERLLGYFTWHADDSPPINPLGDLFKCQVWALARHIGVPSEIVEKPASADLIRGVTDEDELGIAYPEADLVLHWLLSGYGPGELVHFGFAEGDVRIVWDRLQSTHWKRELPTVAVLSSSAIGEFYLRPVDY